MLRIVGHLALLHFNGLSACHLSRSAEMLA
jgi:hypothetical protein